MVFARWSGCSCVGVGHCRHRSVLEPSAILEKIRVDGFSGGCIAINCDSPGNHGDIIIRDNHLRYVDGIISQAPSGSPLAGIAVQIAGAKNLIVKNNVVDLAPANPIQNFRCGAVTYFENKTPGGVLIQGFNALAGTHYSELETLAEDALVLNLIR